MTYVWAEKRTKCQRRLFFLVFIIPKFSAPPLFENSAYVSGNNTLTYS